MKENYNYYPCPHCGSEMGIHKEDPDDVVCVCWTCEHQVTAGELRNGKD